MRTVFRDDHWMLQTQVARFVEQEILPYYAQWEDLGVTPVAVAQGRSQRTAQLRHSRALGPWR